MTDNRKCGTCHNLDRESNCHVIVPRKAMLMSEQDVCPKWEIKKKVLSISESSSPMNSSSIFQNVIKPYPIKILDGKTLEIRVQQEGDMLYMFGYEQSTDTLYLINEYKED